MTESQIQIAIVDYLYILERQKKVLWFTASGNWQFQKSMAIKMKMKREWIRPWLPDLMICFPDSLVFIELKSEKWKATDSQENVLECLNKIWGMVSWHLAYSVSEAKTIINSYIK